MKKNGNSEGGIYPDAVREMTLSIFLALSVAESFNFDAIRLALFSFSVCI